MQRLTTLPALLAAVLCAAPAQAIVREVPGQYATIQLALDDANEGDIVLVAPGNYAETLEVQRSVYLISEEIGGAVIDAGQDDAIRASHLDGGMIQVIGFSIHNCRAAVVVEQSSGAVVDTDISGCMPVDEYEDLIAFNGSGDATVARVTLTANESYDPTTIGLIGLYVDGQSLVVDSHISSSNAAGITLQGDAAMATGNVIEDTGGDAIVLGAYYGVARQNTIERSSGSGVMVPDGVEVLIHDNSITNAEYGVEVQTTGGGGISQVTLLDNTIVSSDQAGVAVLSNVGNLVVGNCEIRDGGSRGIWLQDPDLTALVHDNVISGNEVLGVSIGMAAEGFVEASDITLKRNLIWGNHTQGIQIQDSDALLLNNTIVDNGDYGIYHATSAEEPTFWPTMKNNVVVGHEDTGIWTDYETCELTYSLLYDNAVEASVCAGADGMSLGEDPLFVDREGGDFSLDVDSPAIDAGDPDAAYDDTDGTPNDMGAYGGPEEATPEEDLAPVLEFAVQEDLKEGECTSITIPEGVDPEGLALFVEWSLEGGSNGTWSAYGTAVRLCGEDDGEYSWSTAVTDPFGNSAEADGSLSVVNVSPGITSMMPTSATVGIDYLYQIEVFDPGIFDTFEYVIGAGPEEMTVDDFGVVSWTPAEDEVGDQVIQITAYDDDGGFSTQITTVTVGRGVGPVEEDDCSCRLEGKGTTTPSAALVLLAALGLRRRGRR